MTQTETAHTPSFGGCLAAIASGAGALYGTYAEWMQHWVHPTPAPFGEGTIYDYSGYWSMSWMPAFLMQYLFRKFDEEGAVSPAVRNLIIIGVIASANLTWEAVSHNPNPEFIPDFCVGVVAGIIGTYLGSLPNQKDL